MRLRQMLPRILLGAATVASVLSRAARATWLCLALAALSGCAGGYFADGADFQEENLTKIVVGETTKAEVVALLGEPYHVTEFQNSRQSVFEYFILATATGGGGVLVVYFQVADHKGSTARITFDGRDVVTDIVYQNTGEALYEEYEL